MLVYALIGAALVSVYGLILGVIEPTKLRVCSGHESIHILIRLFNSSWQHAIYGSVMLPGSIAPGAEDVVDAGGSLLEAEAAAPHRRPGCRYLLHPVHRLVHSVRIFNPLITRIEHIEEWWVKEI